MWTICIEKVSPSSPYLGTLVEDGEITTSRTFRTYAALVGWIGFTIEEVETQHVVQLGDPGGSPRPRSGDQKAGTGLRTSASPPPSGGRTSRARSRRGLSGTPSSSSTMASPVSPRP